MYGKDRSTRHLRSSAVAFADGADRFNETDFLDPFDHLETELVSTRRRNGAPCTSGSGASFIS
jgi:hypothetical protein